MSVQAVQLSLIKEASTIIFTFTLLYDRRDPPLSSMVLAIRAYLVYEFWRELMSKAFPRRFYRQIHIYLLTSCNHHTVSPKNTTWFVITTTWVCRNLEDNKILASCHKKSLREEGPWQKGSHLKGEQPCQRWTLPTKRKKDQIGTPISGKIPIISWGSRLAPVELSATSNA